MMYETNQDTLTKEDSAALEVLSFERARLAREVNRAYILLGIRREST